MSKHSDDREVFFCECGHKEHMFIVDHHDHPHWADDECNQFYILPMLAPKPLFKRIAIAWGYLWGNQCSDGAFDSILLDDQDVLRLRDNCDRYLAMGVPERPDAIPPYVWERLTPKERLFIIEHEQKHYEMRRMFAVSEAEYNQIIDDLINEE
jgi:hypothetical protein